MSRGAAIDTTLADAGDERIEWVARHSPVLNRLARDRLGDGSLVGTRVAVVVHLEAKTAYLALLLAEAGAEVVAAGSNPASTQDAVVAALQRRGVEVHARHGSSPEEFESDLLAVAATGPHLIIDDGLELTARLVEHRPDLVGGLRGVTEETTTGIVRLRALEGAGRLTFPAVAANDAWCKHLFDNRFGTGQSTLAAVARLTNTSIAGTRVVVVGYGWVGRGLAQYALGLGAQVTVVEVDAVRALEAVMEGHRVASLRDALPDAGIVLTATGGIDALPASAVAHLRDGALLANAGHHDLEIDVPGLERAAVRRTEPRPGVETFELGDGRRVHLLSRGALVNIAGADGHPVEIMDLSFSVQALAVHHLATHELPAGIHALPPEVDREIARTKLASLGIELDEPTPAQRAFREQWAIS